MGHRSTASQPILALLLLVPTLGGCALLFAGSTGGGVVSETAAPPVAVASPAVQTAPPPVAVASPAVQTAPPAAGSPRALPTVDQLATLLGPDDFTTVGVAGAGTPTSNGEPGSVYAVYAGVSSAGGGIEMDVFVLDTPAAAAAMVVDPGLFALDAVSTQQTGAERATFIGASATNDGTSTYDVIRVQKGRLVAEIGIPTTATSRDQLLALAKLVVDRSAQYQ
jgi:hypothetical protein